MSFMQLLADQATQQQGGIPDYVMWIVLGVIVVLFVVWMVFSNKKRKKQEQEVQDKINAVKPGNKVKTIGGICGIVVEVDAEENTFVLETGTLSTGKSYIKFDKQAIFDTDAVAETPAPEEAPAEDGSQPEAPAEAKAEEKAEEKSEESSQAAEAKPGDSDGAKPE